MASVAGIMWDVIGPNTFSWVVAIDLLVRLPLLVECRDFGQQGRCIVNIIDRCIVRASVRQAHTT